MTRRRQFDLVVIGAEPAGLAAAACAAKNGARVGLVRAGEKAPRAGSSPGVPDFVWRRLNLHESGLEARPVSSRISLLEDGASFKSYASARKTRDALEEADVADHHLWTDFQDNLDRLWGEAEAMTRAAATGAGRGAAGPLLGVLRGADGAGAAERLTATSRAMLDDFFADPDLKTHLASVALMPFGLGGDEAGSGLALASLSEPAGWRIKTRPRGPTLARVLEDAAVAAGVDIIDARIRNIQAADEKARTLVLEDGEAIRARFLMAASVEAAARERLEIAPALSPLARRDGAVAEVRVRFAKAPAPPGADKDAIYYLADSPAALADARDAALEGSFIERPPLSFEFQKDEIIVHAPYCPAFLKTDDEIRDWTEQDRQAFGRQIVARLEPYLNGAARTVRRIDVRVRPAAAHHADAGVAAVIAPPPGQDPIGAAARLAMDLISGE